MSGAAIHAQVADNIQSHIFGGNTLPQLAVDSDAHAFGFVLQQTLCRQYIAHFGRADTNRQRTKGAVRTGVAVATNDSHARLRCTHFGTHHMYDATRRAIPVMQFNTEFFAVIT